MVDHSGLADLLRSEPEEDASRGRSPSPRASCSPQASQGGPAREHVEHDAGGSSSELRSAPPPNLYPSVSGFNHCATSTYNTDRDQPAVEFNRDEKKRMASPILRFSDYIFALITSIFLYYEFIVKTRHSACV